MTATIVGIDPGRTSWGYFAVDHNRNLTHGIYELEHNWRDIHDVLDEIRDWLCDWTLPVLFVVEHQPAMARHLVTRMETAICAVAHVLECHLIRRRPRGDKHAREEEAWAYWKLPELEMPKKRAEHIKDAAWLAMEEDRR